MKYTLFTISLLSLALVGAGCGSSDQQATETPKNTTTANTTIDPTKPDLLIKHLGLTIAPYNPATGMAGDLKFIKTKLGGTDRPLSEFGYIIPGANTSTGLDKPNPQPTFSAPLGTKVRSIVDGEVVRIETLYSNDVSIMVASSKDSPWIYELEHVINPMVKVGDRVKAGDIVAEVSTHDSQHYPGIGIVEIGILHGQNNGRPPEHICPFQYLDPSVKDTLLQQIRDLQTSWEAYRGDAAIHGNDPIAGCVSLEPIEG